MDNDAKVQKYYDGGMKTELERMVELLNNSIFTHPRKLELKIKRREDLGGVMAFLILTSKTVSMPVPPITICWGGAGDADSACSVIIKKFAEGSGLIRRYVPFTAGSAVELKMKLAVFGEEGMSM